MNSFIKSSFFEKLSKLYKESTFIVNIIQNCRDGTIGETIDFFLNSIHVFEDFSYKFNSDLGKIPITELDILIDKLLRLPENLKAYFEIVSKKGKELREIIENNHIRLIEKELKNNRNKQSSYETDIPINYKVANLYLTKEEINTPINPRIQKHRVKGDYESWDRYLNTMFYLVREDCYRSVRNSIFSLTHEAEITYKISREQTDINYYKSVRIINMNIDIKGIVFTVSFETFQSKMSWSKKLLFGSLLIVTSHDFNDMLMATVIEGPDPKIGQKNGKYFCKISIVDTEDASNISKLIQWMDERLNLHMFESKAYYESYRHILKRIQEIDTRDLPFSDVLINFIKAPVILDKSGNIPDLSLMPSHFNDTKSMNYNNQSFYIYKNMWPLTLTSTLDQSQLKAIQLGIRNKVAIIQGPPGTGKTFVGALITKLLTTSSNTPILIVCFTNHALDQFLRHISDFEKRIIRIGGRCKDEVVDQFTLNNIKKNNVQPFNPKTRSLYRNIKIKAEELKIFCRNLKQNTQLSYETCRRYFPFFATRLIDDFFASASYFLMKKPEESNNQLIYNAWINSDILKNLGPKFQFKNKHKLSDLLNYFINLQKNDKNLNKNNYTKKEVNHQEDIKEILEYEDDEDDASENMDRREVEGYDDEDDEEIIYGDSENIMGNFTIEEQTFEEYINDVSIKEIENIIGSSQNIWNLSTKYRVAIMNYLKRTYSQIELENLKPEIDNFNLMLRKKRELDNLFDLDLIQNAKIVGMTTTGCAKYSTFLEQINFETVIIEEAAEVLESHVASIITKNTKHLILIGDHQQLKPNPYSYEISKKYCFEVSLFERLINNEVPHVSLMHQRRMRPEFADFVRLIYGKTVYSDHDNTKNKANNNGFTTNIFFMNHKNREEANLGMASKSNPFEAAFVCGLTKYIIQQNVKPENITILTMYIAQVLLIKNELKKSGIKEIIKVVAVDNYQGEENDFILLSLVRSNKEGQIGFLKTFNRVCVAFSRARLGFYVIGDFDCMIRGQNIQKDSSQLLWSEIFKMAKEKKIIDDKFTFKCQKHKTVNIVKNPSDFNNIPEGGCREICKERLECGHACEYFCHNFEHKKEHCNKPCQRTLPCDHKCSNKCRADCGPCKVKLIKFLPCGHMAETECHVYPSSIYCKEQVKIILNCSHIISKDCSQEITKILCDKKVEVELPCGHKHIKKCHSPIEGEKCKIKCNKLLECEHLCQGTCDECLIGTLHVPCKNVCNRILICSHECKKECSQPCLCVRKCENVCEHAKCNLSCFEECYSCNEYCKVKCKHGQCTNLCKETCNFICGKRCDLIMKCKHQCLGLCSEICPSVCRICDPENEAFQIFFGEEDNPNAIFLKLNCNHVIELSALDKLMTINENSVRVPPCPKCKSPISKNNRYQNKLKDNFQLIQKVKLTMIKQYGSYSDLLNKTNKIVSQIKMELRTNFIKKLSVSCLFGYVSSLEKKEYLAELTSAYNLCCLAKEMFYIETYDANKILEKIVKIKFLKNVEIIKKYFNSGSRCYSNMFFEKLKLKIHSLYLFVQMSNKICPITCSVISSSNFMLTKELIEYFYMHVNKLTKEEMKNIMTVASGTWYQCPDGHLYSVGECGRPMEVSTCPECGKSIGGRNHNPNPNNTQFRGFNHI